MSNRNNTKNNKTNGSSARNKILLSANFFYLLIIIGFFLTTNQDNPVIFEKYTISYLSKLIILFLLIIPYNLMLIFLINDSIFISTNKKKYRITLFLRMVVVLLALITTILFTELFLRMKPKPYIENFHPFLQAITTKKNDGHLHVNSDNFRYDEITKEKPKDVYRIFILGGSTVFDKSRPYEKSLVKQIENSLSNHYSDKKIQVINAGYERYTSQHSLILYETKIADYDPDLIIIWQGFNDMYYSCIPKFTPISEYKNDYSHFYEVLTNITNNYFNYDMKFIAIERLKKVFVENFYSDFRKKISSPESKIEYTSGIQFPSLNAYIRNTTYLVKLAKSDDVKIIIGNQPNNYSDDPGAYGLAQFYCKKDNLYINTESLKKGMTLFNEASKKIALENNVPYIDLESKLPKEWRYFQDDVHYTDEGAKIIADTVYKAIVENSYIN